MHEREEDNLFFRAETTHSQTLNDGAINGYNGVSTFTSSANVKTTVFMQALGYGAKNTYNRYCFEESSPVANLFLNLKYMLERDGKVEENPYFDTVHHFENVYIQKNNAYLPLGFLAEADLGGLEFISGNPFAFQNALFTAATGISTPVWNVTPPEWLSVTGRNVQVTQSTGAGYSSYKADGSTGTLVYTYQIETAGFMCLDLTMPGRNTYNVYRNGQHLFTESISLPQTIAVGQVAPGDKIEVRVTCSANTSNSVNVKTVLLDDAVFRRGYEILAASTLQLTSFSNTEIEGTIHCDRSGLLYTSIPQNGENWHAYVDGKEVPITLVGNVMIGLNLTEGEHTIRFAYRNPAFDTGITVSLVCLGLFLAAILVFYYPVYKPLLLKVFPTKKK
jgi:uncharacterized membrane protein YfhO